MISFLPFNLMNIKNFPVIIFNLTFIGYKHIKILFLCAVLLILLHSLLLPVLQSSSSFYYLILSVTILITANIIATIQNRVTIFGSGYPFF